MLLRPFAGLLSLAAALLLVLVPAAPAEAKRRAAPLPGWSLVGDYDLDVDPGFVSLDGQFSFAFEGITGAISVVYDASTKLVGNGIAHDTIFPIKITSKVKADGLQHVTVVDNPAGPAFAFEGTVTENGRDIVGTYLRASGFAGLAGSAQGETTFRRMSPAPVASTFRLRLETTMDRKGNVRGARRESKEVRAAIDVYPGRTFGGGLVRGKVTTIRGGGTSAKLDIRGSNWSVVMAGPVDVDGFHATAVIRAGGFVATKVPILLEVKAGPQPPPPPPPPDPDKHRRVTGASASNVGGNVQITKNRLATKFFGAAANVTIDFPSSAIGAPMEAKQSSASGAQPIRFFVRIGSKIYGTAAPQGLVTLTVRQFTGVPGGTIEVLCKGKVADAQGRTKTVNMVIDAILGQ